jgi:hypothetical protein
MLLYRLLYSFELSSGKIQAFGPIMYLLEPKGRGGGRRGGGEQHWPFFIVFNTLLLCLQVADCLPPPLPTNGQVC